MNFGETLRGLLAQKGVRQKELAEYLNVMPPAVSNYVQGVREPEYEILTRIADYFGVSVDYLLGHKIAPDGSEETLLTCFRTLTPGQREFLLRQIELLQEYSVLPVPPEKGDAP